MGIHECFEDGAPMNFFVPTKASQLKENARVSHQSVSFHNRKKKELISGHCDVDHNESDKRTLDIADMKTLRYEVIKLGSSGFKGSQKEEANVALMVSLGAAPPKGKPKNYKDHLLQKKREKEEEKNMDCSGRKYKTPYHKQKSGPSLQSKRNSIRGLLDVYGNVKKRNMRRKKRKVKG